LRVLGFACCLQNGAGIQVKSTIGAKATTGFFHGDATSEATVEILLHRFGDPAFYAGVEGLADIHMLARNTEAHGRTTFPGQTFYVCEFIRVAHAYKVPR